MSTKKFENPIGQVFLDAYTTAMGNAAYKDASEIRDEVSDFYDAMFERMGDSIGGEDTPGLVKFSGYRWDSITQDWGDRKGSPNYNRYYVGIGPKKWDKSKGGAYATEMMSKTTTERYGPIEISIEFGGNGDIDVTRVKRDVKLGRYRYKGRFISPKDIGLRIRMDSFPKVKKEQDLAKGFSPRVQRILHYNEPFGNPTGYARPFLQPFFDFYVERALPQRLKKAVKR